VAQSALARALPVQLEPRLARALREARIVPLGPDAEDASFAQGGAHPLERRAAEVGIVGPRPRTLEEIQQDPVPGSPVARVDDVGHVDLLYRDPGVEDGATGQFGQGPAAPVLDHGMQLGHQQLGLLGQRIEGGAQRVPHAESADQDPWSAPTRQLGAGQRRQRLLRATRRTRHQDLAVEQDQVVAVSAPTQLELTIGRRLTVECLPGPAQR